MPDTYIVTGTTPSSFGLLDLYCDVGDPLTGGGSSYPADVQVSLPITDQQTGREGWRLSAGGNYSAYALCLDIAPAHNAAASVGGVAEQPALLAISGHDLSVTPGVVLMLLAVAGIVGSYVRRKWAV